LRFFALELLEEFELELLLELLDEFELELLLEFELELLDEFMLELLDEFELEFELELPAVASGAPTATTPHAARPAAHFLLSISDLASGLVERSRGVLRSRRKPSVRRW
jgi:hypothetical protein